MLMPRQGAQRLSYGKKSDQAGQGGEAEQINNSNLIDNLERILAEDKINDGDSIRTVRGPEPFSDQWDV